MNRIASPLAFALIGMLSFAGCRSKPPPAPLPPKLATITITVEGSDDLNPNGYGRPSPVVVHLYALRDASTFEAASSEGLAGHARESLAASLSGEERAMVYPGATKTLTLSIVPDVQFIGVAAEFFNSLGSTGRAYTARPDRPRDDAAHRQLHVVVSKDRITIGQTS